MKKEYHIVLKNSINFVVYADYFDIINYPCGNNNYMKICFYNKKGSPIMRNIPEYSVDEIYHYRNIFSDDRIIDYKALPFPDPDLYVDLS